MGVARDDQEFSSKIPKVRTKEINSNVLKKKVTEAKNADRPWERPQRERGLGKVFRNFKPQWLARGG